MPKTLKIGFMSAHDPFDRTAFSGTTFHAARALRAVPGVDVTILGPHRRQSDLMRRIRRRLPSRGLDPAAFDPTGQDVTIALVASGLIDTVKGENHPPLYHVTDATPGFLAEFYGHDIGPEIYAREDRVVQTARRAVYSSAYMAHRAGEDFGLAPSDLAVVPFGVNFDTIPAAPAENPYPPPLRLLYVGTKWRRKGGDIALAAFQALTDRGITAELTLVGEPPDGAVPDNVVVAGFLNKNEPADAARLTALFDAAHIFVLPTRADCTPMVVAEANVFGVPVLITETGGIGSLIKPGENGQMLSMEATGQDWADAIEAMVPDLPRLRTSSHNHASTHLTWDSWAHQLVDIIRRDLHKDAAPTGEI